MKTAFPGVSSVVPGLTVWSLLARLCPGEAGPLPVSRSCGTGSGGPPATAGEVAQTFRSHSKETPGKNFQLYFDCSMHPWSTDLKKMGKLLLVYFP